MRKFLTALLLTWGCVTLLPPKGHAVPIDVPYQILVSTTNTNASKVVISTNNFPSANTTVNTSATSSQWCLTHVAVTPPPAATAVTFNIAYSSFTLAPYTTDYTVIITTTGAYAFNQQWEYKVPYCAPVGWPVLTITDGVAGSTFTVEGYLWKGWN